MHLLLQVGLVALGSAIGGLLRWGVGVGFGRAFGTAFPWGTLFINVSGSLFLGWFMTVVGERLVDGLGWLGESELRLLVAVGFTGAYTTFSTYEYDAYLLFRDGDGLEGLTYTIGSVVSGLVAVWLGVRLARW